jgi:aspartyl-tRNA(Asn)/glutamyl-tRNA(Gln) amidotransferase subunit A
MVGAVLPTSVHTLAARVRAVIGRKLLDAFDSVDVLVGAHRTAAPLIVDRAIVNTREAARAEQGKLATGHSTAFAMAGMPSASVPCGFNGIGLPLSMHIATRQLDEVTLLRVARAYQSITDWHVRRPPMEWADRIPTPV